MIYFSGIGWICKDANLFVLRDYIENFIITTSNGVFKENVMAVDKFSSNEDIFTNINSMPRRIGVLVEDEFSNNTCNYISKFYDVYIMLMREFT